MYGRGQNTEKEKGLLPPQCVSRSTLGDYYKWAVRHEMCLELVE